MSVQLVQTHVTQQTETLAQYDYLIEQAKDDYEREKLVFMRNDYIRLSFPNDMIETSWLRKVYFILVEEDLELVLDNQEMQERFGTILPSHPVQIDYWLNRIENLMLNDKI